MYAEIDGNNVKLYGTIWQGDGPYIVSSLKKLLASNGDVKVNVHSPGGSVIDGNLIFNAFKQSKANITIEIDGLAASMMSIIMLAGNKVRMASNAFIMIHAPSGYNQGNAKSFESTAKVLRAMEKSFLQILSAKMETPEADLAELMNGDNWYTAQEALDAKLIDEIIDPILSDNAEMSAYQDIKMVASLFSAWDKPTEEHGEKPPVIPIQTQNNSQNNVKMKLNAKSMQALGLDENSTEEQINAAIENQQQKVERMQQKEKADLKARAEKLVTDAVAVGKILGSEKEQYLQDAEANYDLTERMLAKVPGKGNLSSTEKPEGKVTADDRSAWTFDNWRKKDPKGLIEMKSANPDGYAEILNKK
jgi:ATP-dependent Clp endopeptidase proteolytic subunit ClpP